MNALPMTNVLSSSAPLEGVAPVVPQPNSTLVDNARPLPSGAMPSVAPLATLSNESWVMVSELVSEPGNSMAQMLQTLQSAVAAGPKTTSGVIDDPDELAEQESELAPAAEALPDLGVLELPAMQALPPSISAWRQMQAVGDDLRAAPRVSPPMDRLTSGVDSRAVREGVSPPGVDPLPWPAAASSTELREPLMEQRLPLPAAVSSATQAAVPVQRSVQPLIQALAERIQVQQAQGLDVATVRLDPPQMGSLEIRISQDGAGVRVHLQASNIEVGRQLSQLVDSLRQELQARSSEVQVTVAQGRPTAGQGEQSRGGHADQTEQEPSIGQALQLADPEAAAST